ncbi:MAG: hypothetical protein EOP47_00155 [Sphingobacteriaceae bacterium]|nr:MAG: hypothetical protein EOP47_00155 [Sphingobacteriaceae bacterium]
MKILKLIAWIILFMANWFLSVGIAVAVFSMTGPRHPITLILGALALVSPFFTIKILMEKLYPGVNGKQSATVAAYVAIGFTGLYFLGAIVKQKSIGQQDYMFALLQSFFVISLFFYDRILKKTK